MLSSRVKNFAVAAVVTAIAAVPTLARASETTLLKSRWDSQLEATRQQKGKTAPKVSANLKGKHVIFVSGFLNEGFLDYFKDNKTVVEELGATAEVLPPSSLESIEANSAALVEIIDKHYKATQRPVVLVGHSKGGAEALYTVLKHPHMVLSGRVDRVIIIQGAIGGSAVADFALSGQVADILSGSEEPVEEFMSEIPGIELLPKGILEGLTSLKMQVAKGTFSKALKCFKTVPGTPEDALCGEDQRAITMKDQERVSRKIFYVRSSKHDDVSMVLIPTNSFLNKGKPKHKKHPFKGAPNDGLLQIQDQILEGIGIDLGILNADHAGLVTAQYGNLTTKERASFTRALFETIEETTASLPPISAFLGEPVLQTSRPLRNIDAAKYEAVRKDYSMAGAYKLSYRELMTEQCEETPEPAICLATFFVDDYNTKPVISTEVRVSMLLGALEALREFSIERGDTSGETATLAIDFVSEVNKAGDRDFFTDRMKHDPSSVYLIQDMKNSFWRMADSWAKKK